MERHVCRLDIESCKWLHLPQIFFATQFSLLTPSIFIIKLFFHDAVAIYFYYKIIFPRCCRHLDGYQTSDIIYKWVSEGTPRVGVAITLPSFNLISITDYESEFGLTTGNFSRIGVKFIIERQLTGYFFRLYIPLILIVITSFVPFYLSFKLVVTRLILSLICFIMFALISVVISTTLTPKTGEFTTLDLYLVIGFLFSLSSLVLIILGIKWNHEINSNEHAHQISEAANDQRHNQMMKSDSNGQQGGTGNRKSESCESAIEMNERGTATTMAYHCARSDLSTFVDPHLLLLRNKSNGAKIADQVESIILPILFLFFNILYWITSLLFPAALLG